MYLIDTNISLEILLEQEKADECEELLKEIRGSRKLFYLSFFTIHSIEIIMTRNNQCEALSAFLYFLKKSKITRLETDMDDDLNIIQIMKEFNLDFDDAVQLYLCQKHNLKIISYDQHFDKTSIERIEPKDIGF